jgi:hypothetical protein
VPFQLRTRRTVVLVERSGPFQFRSSFLQGPLARLEVGEADSARLISVEQAAVLGAHLGELATGTGAVATVVGSACARLDQELRSAHMTDDLGPDELV